MVKSSFLLNRDFPIGYVSEHILQDCLFTDVFFKWIALAIQEASGCSEYLDSFIRPFDISSLYYPLLSNLH